jgi:hypothetical protein
MIRARSRVNDFLRPRPAENYIVFCAFFAASFFALSSSSVFFAVRSPV